jgi:hypothetical protein
MHTYRTGKCSLPSHDPIVFDLIQSDHAPGLHEFNGSVLPILTAVGIMWFLFYHNKQDDKRLIVASAPCSMRYS